MAYRDDVVDRASHSVFPSADGSDEQRQAELSRTIAELTEYFSEADIITALAEAGLATASGSDREAIMQAIRAFSVLVIESDRPRLTAQLVGKLVGLELATGKRIILRQLGRDAGISKQAVSKRMALYAERLGLDRPDSRPEARESHRLMNRRNFQRPIATATG